jgi:hypothetical protein
MKHQLIRSNTQLTLRDYRRIRATVVIGRHTAQQLAIAAIMPVKINLHASRRAAARRIENMGGDITGFCVHDAAFRDLSHTIPGITRQYQPPSPETLSGRI